MMKKRMTKKLILLGTSLLTVISFSTFFVSCAAVDSQPNVPSPEFKPPLPPSTIPDENNPNPPTNPDKPTDPLPPTNPDKPTNPPTDPIPQIPSFPEGITEANFKAYYDDPETDPYTPRPPFIGGAYVTPEDQKFDRNGNLISQNDFIHGKTLNSNYQFIADRTVSIWIKERENRSENGTGWWMDYLKTDDGTYPTTWYLATNVHVVTALKSNEDNYGERDHKTFAHLTESVEIGWLNDITQAVTYEKLTNMPKTMFAAVDFLEGNAGQVYGSKYLEDNRVDFFANHSLMLDFAIMEIVFDNADQAKRVTKDLAKDQTQPVVKFKNNLYFNEKTRRQLEEVNDLYVAGFPGDHQGIFAINKLNRDEANASTGTKFGNRLISEVSNYKKRSLAGMFDQMTEFNFQWVFDATEYKRGGIAYELELTDFWPGASGSMGINSQNEVIGIYWGFMGGATSTDLNQPRTGFLDPLISPYGYIDSHGYYAPFRYDLIYGGIPGQIKSYKSKMQQYHQGKSTPLLGSL